MNRSSQTRATLDDFQRAPGKAELIGGRIVEYMATGERPGHIAGNIYVSLREHSKKTRTSNAYTDSVGFAVPELASGRESFSPDASYYTGQLPSNRMRFIEGPPTLAVEVRSENDYGPAAEADMAAKRADYFEAGSQIVWDVDTLGEQVHIYRASAPDHPVTCQRGQSADAEPAVPVWQISVDEVFWLPQ